MGWGNKIWGEKDKHELWTLGVDYGDQSRLIGIQWFVWCYNNHLWNL